MHDPDFTTTLTRLVSVMEDHDLSTPLCLSWSTYPRPHLSIQVEARYFRAWSEVVTTSHVDARNIDDVRLMHLYGTIGEHRVMLTAVAPLTDQREPVLA